jgi:hypothetical protein
VRNNVFAREKGAEPKKPLYADNGLGCGEVIESPGSKY